MGASRIEDGSRMQPLRYSSLLHAISCHEAAQFAGEEQPIARGCDDADGGGEGFVRAASGEVSDGGGVAATTEIVCEYPLIHRSNSGPWHFIHAFHQFLGERLEVRIEPAEFRRDIHLSANEKSWMSQVQEITKAPVPFWIVVSGGKFDFTAKWWDPARMQKVVD